MEDHRHGLADDSQGETVTVSLTLQEAGVLLGLLMQAQVPLSQAEQALVLRDKLRAVAPSPAPST